MNISERLTQEKLLELLKDTYIKGQEEESKVEDLLNEIKCKVLIMMNKED